MSALRLRLAKRVNQGQDIAGLLETPLSVAKWLTIGLPWLLLKKYIDYGSKSRIPPLRGIELF
jgi:hypothetical protein